MSGTLSIDVYVSDYCPYCRSGLAPLLALQTINGWPVRIRKRDVIKHLDAAVSAGVRSTPSFVVNGRLVASGRLTVQQLGEILRNVPMNEAKNGSHD